MSCSTAFRWRINPGILGFVLIFLPITLGLGVWQLHRAEEKQLILEQQATLGQLTALHNDELLDAESLHLRRFDLRVEFDAQRWFLLDNRVRDGRPGYEVLNLARLVGNDVWLLVNRGWTPADLDRTRLPAIAVPVGTTRIQGVFYAPSEREFQLGTQTWTGRWPERVQYADLAVIQQRLEADERLVAAQLRLAAEDPAALVADWQVVNQPPQRHTAYAVQWFAMALALVILGIFANSNLAERWSNPEKN